MPGDWKRPESVPFPSIWTRFDGKREINGKIPKFWIQDIPEDLFEEAVNIMCANYIFDEPMCKFTKLAKDPISVEEVRGTWRLFAEDKVGLICFMENPDPVGKPIIVGLNMTYVCTKDEETTKFNGKKWAKLVDAMAYVYHIHDVYDQLGINEYMSALGLSVLPKFRGQGIGDELLKARTVLGRAVGLKATLTAFTAIASQKIAERVGFKDIIAITFEELESKNPTFTFPGITSETKSVRFMYKLF